MLVTGGTGFVAGWCIVELLERGYAVRTTVRDPAKEQRVRAAVPVAPTDDRLTFVVADLNRTKVGTQRSRDATTCCTLPHRSAVVSRRIATH